jgi:hypothetical protein
VNYQRDQGSTIVSRFVLRRLKEAMYTPRESRSGLVLVQALPNDVMLAVASMRRAAHRSAQPAANTRTPYLKPYFSTILSTAKSEKEAA